MIYRAVTIWAVLLIFAMVIGGGKVAFIIPKLGEHIGQIIGTLIFCPVIFAVTWYSIRWINPNGIRDAIIVGILWLILIEAFEFLAGRYLFGKSLGQLFYEYKIWEGRIWVLILATLLASPIIAAKLRIKSCY
jgi:hypothetical protein